MTRWRLWISLGMLAGAATASARDYTLVSAGPTNESSTIATRLVALAPSASRIVFTTQDPLGAQDVDTVLDLYEWESGVVTLLTPGSAFPVTWKGASLDASRVAFETSEPLLGDGDGNLDVFVSDGGALADVSGGSESLPARYRGMSANGSRVWFVTEEALDEVQVLVDQDVYEWSGGVVSQISTGPGDEGFQDADWAGASPDGSRVYFVTTEILCPFLEAEFPFDAFLDGVAIYERFGDTVTCLDHSGDRTLFGSFLDVSDAGGRMLFSTFVDLDGSELANGGHLFSTVSEGVLDRVSVDAAGTPFEGFVQVVHVSADGERVTFETALDGAGDGDGRVDVFQNGPAGTSRLSFELTPTDFYDANFVAATPDGRRVVFETREQLLFEDTDDSVDVYAWDDGALSLVSIGPIGGQGAFDATGVAMSEDGRNVVFASNETLRSDDPAGRDLFGRINGTDTVLLTPSTGQLFGIEFAGLSSDGRTLVLRTRNALAAADTDSGKDDLYVTTVDEVPEPSHLALATAALLALARLRQGQ